MNYDIETFENLINSYKNHKALYLLKEVNHPVLIFLFPRLQSKQIFSEHSAPFVVGVEAIIQLKSYIKQQRIKTWIMAGFYILAFCFVIAWTIFGVILLFDRHPASTGVICLGIALIPVLLFPLWLVILSLKAEISSEFYSVL